MEEPTRSALLHHSAAIHEHHTVGDVSQRNPFRASTMIIVMPSAG